LELLDSDAKPLLRYLSWLEDALKEIANSSLSGHGTRTATLEANVGTLRLRCKAIAAVLELV